MGIPRVLTLILLFMALDLPVCHASGRPPRGDTQKVTVTVIQPRTATITHQYIGQINSHRHIEVRTPAGGYIVAIPVKMGQAVKKGDLLFQVGPTLNEPKPGVENRLAVSIKAPFDGLVGRLPRQQGSLVLKGETLTTLSDNSRIWVYFDVPEARYLEYMADVNHDQEDPKIELVLFNGNKFPHVGKIGAIRAEFNPSTGNITFRADFPNPEGLLRHGQTGTVLIHHVLNDAVVIPQRATFERLNRRYVYVVDKNHRAHPREIVIQKETEDSFVVKEGVGVGDTIVLEGVRLVRDGSKAK